MGLRFLVFSPIDNSIKPADKTVVHLKILILAVYFSKGFQLEFGAGETHLKQFVVVQFRFTQAIKKVVSSAAAESRALSALFRQIRFTTSVNNLSLSNCLQPASKQARHVSPSVRPKSPSFLWRVSISPERTDQHRFPNTPRILKQNIFQLHLSLSFFQAKNPTNAWFAEKLLANLQISLRTAASTRGTSHSIASYAAGHFRWGKYTHTHTHIPPYLKYKKWKGEDDKRNNLSRKEAGGKISWLLWVLGKVLGLPCKNIQLIAIMFLLRAKKKTQ